MILKPTTAWNILLSEKQLNLKYFNHLIAYMLNDVIEELYFSYKNNIFNFINQYRI